MIDLGKVRPGSTIRIPFSSFDKDDGSSITMTNYAVADILIYKDGSTTERASTAGFTATTDFDTKTGKHLCIIDLADNTTAGFFAAGSEYLVAIDAVTVDAVTTGGWIARFRIGYEGSMFDTTIATLSSQTSFTLTAGPAEDDALNDQWCIIHDVASAVQCGKAIISDYTGSTKTVTLAAGTTFTAAATDNISIMGLAPLQPTVAARKLDVSTGGEAGLDWANVGSPTTTVGLSGTTVKTATDVETDTADIQSRLPATLVSGRMDSNVQATASALTFNLTGDITGNLSGSVGSVTGAVGSVTGNVGGNVTGSVGSVTGAVGSVTGNVGGNVTGSVGSVATGGITAASIATGAIDADALATDAVDEIADGVWDEVLTGASHNITNSAGRRLRTLQDVGNYLGYVWIDTNGANTGSTFPDDGTFLNPVNTLANALTVAAAATQPIKEFSVLQGSTITLAGTFSGYDFDGENWTLELGGQDISNSRFNRAAAGVSGTATGTNPFFYECSIGNATLPPSAFQTCGFTGTLTVGSAGAYYFVDCFSQVAGTSTPTFDMGAAVGATSLNIRRWSGGLTINNIASGDVISIDCVSGGTITLNGADGNVQVRGMCNVVDNRTGSPTLGTTNNMDARFDSVDSTIAAILTDTAEIGVAGAGLTEAGGTGDQLTALPTLAQILAGGDIDGYTLEQTLKLCLSALAGKLSGAATTTITIRAADDSKDRITATVDADGNRSAVTLDAAG